MSTVQRVNFEPVSDINPIHRRDFPLADASLANPSNVVALVDGEWMKLDASAKLARATAIASVGDPALTLSWPLFAERGRYDIQAMSQRKMPILFMGQYEFNTRIFDASVTIASGAPITTMLQPLKVATVTIGSRNYTGLVGAAYADNAAIVGYVTRLPANNGGQLRFMSGWAVRNGST